MKAKKFTLIAPDYGYEIYAKPGTLAGKDRGPERLTQIRIVPYGPHWSIPTGADGETLATLEEDGNGMTFNLEGQKLRLNYVQIEYLEYLLKAQKKLRPPWWEEPEWYEQEYSPE